MAHGSGWGCFIWQVWFSTSLTFYVTPLDSSCSAVLGYNWLKQYNPLVDWSSGQITFRSTLHRGLAPSTSLGTAKTPHAQPPPETPNLPEETPSPKFSPIITPPLPIPTSTDNSAPINTPHISFINAAAYQHASRLMGSQVFQISLSDVGLSGNSNRCP